MLDLSVISEFSRTNCIAICAFLVPANLLATLTTVALAAFQRPTIHLRMAFGVASLLAVTMAFHVWTWLAIGVVMAPTYILLFLASLCLTINLSAIAFPGWFANFRFFLQQRFQQ